eukprot:m.784083 g.784083  ORF g.784083 m.784083 type:complete len:496 (+) comp59155_c0_seq25:1168-2655(+)
MLSPLSRSPPMFLSHWRRLLRFLQSSSLFDLFILPRLSSLICSLLSLICREPRAVSGNNQSISSAHASMAAAAASNPKPAINSSRSGQPKKDSDPFDLSGKSKSEGRPTVNFGASPSPLPAAHPQMPALQPAKRSPYVHGPAIAPVEQPSSIAAALQATVNAKQKKNGWLSRIFSQKLSRRQNEEQKSPAPASNSSAFALPKKQPVPIKDPFRLEDTEIKSTPIARLQNPTRARIASESVAESSTDPERDRRRASSFSVEGNTSHSPVLFQRKLHRSLTSHHEMESDSDTDSEPETKHEHSLPAKRSGVALVPAPKLVSPFGQLPKPPFMAPPAFEAPHSAFSRMERPKLQRPVAQQKSVDGSSAASGVRDRPGSLDLRKILQPHHPSSPSSARGERGSRQSASVDDGHALETAAKQGLRELLRAIGLPDCIRIFEAQEIDMDTFLTLTESDLAEIGIEEEGVRGRISSAILALRRKKVCEDRMASFCAYLRGRS